ncbi:unnamed protein product [Bursaphelenchus xylophilus]|uniref:(pine wood nematode) hypothetical protein n=1 Tax=Bursaphelenchus xylophilus TaxID=6326 RepID=A0A1I7S0G5_BURXY|nr:unnamed protein product [Bursaphelenchus xylophilus]CAG9132246.1 unnamed protein product [Bursaphelenchus xylophilus]
MRQLFVPLFFCAILVDGHFRFNKLRRIVKDNTQLLKQKLTSPRLADIPSDQWFIQKLDHFNESVTDTWRQRFWVNEEFYEAGGPELLNIGGEGPEDPYGICYTDLPIVQWAKKLKARLWNLEHRFYGESRPTPNQSVENLKYLTSQQALADLADFIDAQNANKTIQNPRWVVFGGSYPGALALWFRDKYPTHAIGAVGSSAPIDIQMDFYGYLRVCQDAYRNQSPKCAENIGKAFDQLHRLMDFAKGRSRLEAALHITPELEKQNLTFTDLQNLYANVFEMFQGAVQYSRVNAGRYATGYSVPDVCKIMEEPVFSPVTHLIKVHKYLFDSDVFPDDYQRDIVDILKDEEFGEDSSMRSWIWQTCNEFGYFQSTAFEKNIFGVGTPADYYYNMCSDVYGKEFNVDYIKAAVQRTIDHYGRAEDYKGTNVVIPNGSIDPWHALGTYVNDTAKNQYSYLIEGSAHCADMCPPGENDVPGLTHIRKVILEKLQEWTKVENNNDDDSNRTIKKKVEAEEKKEEKAEQKPVEHEPGRVCFGCGGQRKPLIRNGEFNLMSGNEKFRGGRLIGRPMLLGQDEDILFGLDKETPNISEFQQILDHFETDESKVKNFTQYFYINEEHYKPGGPQFLFIGGEDRLGTKFLFSENIPLVQYAKETNAVIYGLEHRYYGDSVPVEDFSVKNLVYLTSQQALADIKYFIESINVEKKYTDPKWITFGGSYAGALSAWFRQKYPEVTVGTVGSSGPVEAKVDFFEYDQVVQDALKDCKGNIKKGIDQLQHLSTTIEGRKIINDKLVPCSPADRFDVETVDPFDEMEFFSDLVGRFMGRIQYSTHGPHGTIYQICKIWNDNTTDAFYKFRESGRHCYSTDFDANIRQLSDISADANDATYRLWFWQTCNEFGYYQSTDIGYNTFGSGVPVNYYIEWCRRAYDPSFTRDKIEANIKKTQEFYGGARGYKATRHIHVQGSVDPWHALGFYMKDGEDHGRDVSVHLVEGTSHCYDMYPPSEFDPKGLTEARTAILNKIREWVAYGGSDEKKDDIHDF